MAVMLSLVKDDDRLLGWVGDDILEDESGLWVVVVVVVVVFVAITNAILFWESSIKLFGAISACISVFGSFCSLFYAFLYC